MACVNRSLLAALAVLPAACRSPHDGPAPATPQRPTVSSDTNTTAAGTVELEGGIVSDPGDSFDVPLTLKVGLEERTELFLALSPYQQLDVPDADGQGTGDLVVGTRHRFWESESEASALAFSLATKLPTGSESAGLSSGEIDFLGALIGQTRAGDVGLVGYWNHIVQGQSGGSGTDTVNVLAAVAGLPLDDRWSTFAELSTFLAEEDDDTAFLILGGGYAVAPSAILDLAAQIGLNGASEDFRLQIGATVNFGPILARKRGPDPGS
jgi:hypothetical protein